MTFPDDLPESVRRLVRPRLALRDARQSRYDEVCGVWGGAAAVPLPLSHSGRTLPHLLSVDCQWLADNGFGVRGSLSVYADGLDVAMVNDPDQTFACGQLGGIPLFGQEEESWPEEEALVAYLPPNEIAAVTSAEWAADYFRFAQQVNPLFREGLAAVLGGWHVNWPDGPPRLPRLADLQARIDRAGGPGVMPYGETYRCEPYRLLLWTLRDAEPWFEVWGDGAGELHAVGRVT
jgi:hypothetical protein